MADNKAISNGIPDRALPNAWAVAFLAAVAALAVLFHFYGSTAWTGSSRSLFRWLGIMWNSEADAAVDYSHGYLIPFVSLWLLWRKRSSLRCALAHPAPHAFGLALWLGAMAMLFVGLRAQIPHLGALGFIVALWSLVWTFYGKEAARHTLFPIAYLLFAVPIGFLAQATFPLRLFGSIVATAILNGLGIETVRRGTAVFSTTGQGFALDVADPCSGIRSLMTLMALTAGYAYVRKQSQIERALLFACSLPVAVAANIGRIVTIAFAILVLGEEKGMTLYHDYSGYLVFVIAVLLVIGAERVLDSGKGLFAKVRAKTRNARQP